VASPSPLQVVNPLSHLEVLIWHGGGGCLREVPSRTALTRVSTAGWRRRWLLSVCDFAQRASLVTTLKAARSPQTSPFGKSQTVKIDKSAPAAKMNSRAFAPFPTKPPGRRRGGVLKGGPGLCAALAHSRATCAILRRVQGLHSQAVILSNLLSVFRPDRREMDRQYRRNRQVGS